MLKTGWGDEEEAGDLNELADGGQQRKVDRHKMRVYERHGKHAKHTSVGPYTASAHGKKRKESFGLNGLRAAEVVIRKVCDLEQPVLRVQHELLLGFLNDCDARLKHCLQVVLEGGKLIL